MNVLCHCNLKGARETDTVFKIPTKVMESIVEVTDEQR